MKSRVVLIFMVVMSVFLITGCSEVREFINTFKADDETMEVITTPGEEGDPEAEVEKYKQYVDKKTGEHITKTQYDLYAATDALKVQGLIVAVCCWIAGFLIRFIVKRSTKIRRLGLFLELVPFVYIVVVYFLAFIADAA